VPNPDGVKAKNGFNFDRLGIRVPTIVISPWIKKGTVVHKPTGAQAPLPTSQYDSTSIQATVNKIFGVKGHTSNRASWAGTFEHIFTQMDEPRKDCPMVLEDLGPVDLEDLEFVRNLPLNDHLETQIGFYCKFNKRGEDCGKGIVNQYQASLFIEKEVKYFFEKTLKQN
jgi:phospholipase C